MLTLTVGAGVVEKILNEGLVVLTPQETRPLGVRNLEGESLRLEESSPDGNTGRAFFARGMHDLGGGYLQVTLQPFMEDANSETGIPERMPMAGQYANEKHVIPASTMDLISKGQDAPFDIAVKGERPIWLYRGAKWIAEFSLSHLFFYPKASKEIVGGKPSVPDILFLNVQGQGGESTYRYGLLGPVGHKA